MQKVRKTPVQIVDDYLRELWSHSRQYISDEDGLDLAALSYVNLVVTVPVYWPAYGQSRMAEALAYAGLLDFVPNPNFVLDFVTDAGKAAFNVIDKHRQHLDLGSNALLMVCDAGGSTVDAIMYQVMSPDPFNVLTYTEPGIDTFGATLLEQNFSAMLKGRISPHDQNVIINRALSKVVGEKWELGIKPFLHTNNRYWNLRLEFSSNSVRDYEINVPVEIARKAACGPVIQRIRNLIKKQFERAEAASSS